MCAFPRSESVAFSKPLVRREVPSKEYWSFEHLLCNGNALAASLEDAITSAKKSIDLAVYIFADDSFGRRIETLLIAAAQRGIDIRVCVDGVGSRGWIWTSGRRLLASGVQVKVYHPLFWEGWFSTSSAFSSSHSWSKLFSSINRRDHRKLCIFDGTSALVSSMNIWDLSLFSLNNGEPWCELGIQVQGVGVKILTAAFELSWYPLRFKDRSRHSQNLEIINQSPKSFVRLNTTRRLRRHFSKAILEKVRAAVRRVCIATPYFVPTRAMMDALVDAVQRGVEVQIVTSEKSDVFFMPWVAAEYQRALIRRGIQMFCYQPSVYHAKYFLIDDYAIIGSSNMNRRSLHHDLEVDIVTENPKTLEELVCEFEKVLQKSRSVREKNFRDRPFWQIVLGRWALLIRNNL